MEFTERYLEKYFLTYLIFLSPISSIWLNFNIILFNRRMNHTWMRYYPLLKVILDTINNFWKSFTTIYRWPKQTILFSVHHPPFHSNIKNSPVQTPIDDINFLGKTLLKFDGGEDICSPMLVCVLMTDVVAVD